MFRFITLLILLFIIITTQVSADDILIKKSFFYGWQYSTTGTSYITVGVSGDGLRGLMKKNLEARNHMLKYRKNNYWAMTTGVTSILLISVPVGYYIDKGKWEDSFTPMLLSSIPLMIISLILDSAASKNIKKAVRLYNSKETSLSMSLKYLPTYNTDQNKMILSLNFNF